MSRFNAISSTILLAALLSGCGGDKDGDDNGNPDRRVAQVAESVRHREWGNFPAPEIAGKDSKGDPFAIGAHRGKVVMLDFWATWCGPCRRLIPHEKAMVKRLEGKPFVLLGISADRQLSDLTKYEDSENLSWRNRLTRQLEIPANYEIEGYPTIVLIDHEGIIRYRFEGVDPKTEKELDAAIEVLLKKVPAKS